MNREFEIKKFLGPVVIALLAGTILLEDGPVIKPDEFSGILKIFQQFYLHSPLYAIVIFMGLHLIASTFSIPGSCTLLNISAGAFFGFIPGSIIVYSITVISACLGYFLGKKLMLSALFNKFRPRLEKISGRINNADSSSLLLLRLSPVVPFGVMNLLCGLLRIDFRLYLITTIIGVFFDVFLLNAFGAMLSGHSAGWLSNKFVMAGLFFFLLILFYSIKNTLADKT